MPRLGGEGAPEKVLVEGKRPAVRVAALEVRVCGREVGRREGDASQDGGLEVRDVRCEPPLDPVGVALAELLRPLAPARVELAGSVAADVPRQLLELDPQDRESRRRAAWIERRGLADDDCRLRGKQPALRLVHGA